jgi:hypothetical protein
MSYAIVGFGKIGQALAHAFARKDMDVTVQADARLRSWSRRLVRLGQRLLPSHWRKRSRRIRSFWPFRLGNIERLRRRCRVGKAKRSSTR